jgi:hypothetical protein
MNAKTDSGHERSGAPPSPCGKHECSNGCPVTDPRCVPGPAAVGIGCGTALSTGEFPRTFATRTDVRGSARQSMAVFSDLLHMGS